MVRMHLNFFPFICFEKKKTLLLSNLELSLLVFVIFIYHGWNTSKCHHDLVIAEKNFMMYCSCLIYSQGHKTCPNE